MARNTILLISLDVGNKLLITHFWIIGAEVKKIFKDRCVIMLQGLKIKERTRINGGNIINGGNAVSSSRLVRKTDDSDLIKSLSGTK